MGEFAELGPFAMGGPLSPNHPDYDCYDHRERRAHGEQKCNLPRRHSMSITLPSVRAGAAGPDLILVGDSLPAAPSRSSAACQSDRSRLETSR